LFLRAKEQIAKISFILAAPEGLRDIEHVRWAYALVRHDVESKIRVILGNDLVKDAPKTALVNRIEDIISGEDGETFGVICNKLRNKKKEDIKKCLDDLISANKVKLETSIHPRRKIKVERYKLK
jgi:hypothetical protein